MNDDQLLTGGSKTKSARELPGREPARPAERDEFAPAVRRNPKLGLLAVRFVDRSRYGDEFAAGAALRKIENFRNREQLGNAGRRTFSAAAPAQRDLLQRSVSPGPEVWVHCPDCNRRH